MAAMEMLFTNVIASLTLSALLTLSQQFGQGVQKMGEKDYPGAIAAFTVVLAQNGATQPLAEPALYWRATCYESNAQPAQAQADLDRILTLYPKGAIAELALADYARVAGKPWAGVDLSTPEGSWATLRKLIKEKNADLLPHCLAGQLKAMMPVLIAREDAGWEEMARSFGAMEFGSAFYNAESNKACVAYANPERGARTGYMIMVREGQAWRLSGEATSRERREFETVLAGSGVVTESVWNENINRLRQLDAAVEQYMMASRDSPRQLSDAADYVRDFSDTRICTVDNQPFVMAYAKAGGNKPWIYMATAVEGKRLALTSSGLRVYTETQFRELASNQQVRLSQDWTAVTLSAEEQESIRALVRQLGAPEFARRREAREKLQALGVKAGLLLKEATQDGDPEIAQAAQELLSDL